MLVLTVARLEDLEKTGRHKFRPILVYGHLPVLFVFDDPATSFVLSSWHSDDRVQAGVAAAPVEPLQRSSESQRQWAPMKWRQMDRCFGPTSSPVLDGENCR
jgi:hypothetical protein